MLRGGGGRKQDLRSGLQMSIIGIKLPKWQHSECKMIDLTRFHLYVTLDSKGYYYALNILTVGLHSLGKIPRSPRLKLGE